MWSNHYCIHTNVSSPRISLAMHTFLYSPSLDVKFFVDREEHTLLEINTNGSGRLLQLVVNCTWCMWYLVSFANYGTICVRHETHILYTNHQPADAAYTGIYKQRTRWFIAVLRRESAPSRTGISVVLSVYIRVPQWLPKRGLTSYSYLTWADLCDQKQCKKSRTQAFLSFLSDAWHYAVYNICTAYIIV